MWINDDHAPTTKSFIASFLFRVIHPLLCEKTALFSLLFYYPSRHQKIYMTNLKTAEGALLKMPLASCQSCSSLEHARKCPDLSMNSWLFHATSTSERNWVLLHVVGWWCKWSFLALLLYYYQFGSWHRTVRKTDRKSVLPVLSPCRNLNRPKKTWLWMNLA